MRVPVFLFFLPFLSIYAQESAAEISGRILNESLSDPLAYIRIELKDLSNHITAETLSDEKGIFHLKNLSNGTYVLQVSMSGFQPYSQKIEIFNKPLVLKDISLKAHVSDEVVKTAERTTLVNKIDRKVLNVGKDLISAGSSAADVLNNIPSVSVDQQTGALSLRGDSNARVLIDGKPSNIPAEQLLKQLSSDAIDKVELISSPSSKYNPEGASGIINIILKKGKKKGYHINLNSGLISRKYMSYNTSVNANLSTGKLNFFTNYDYNKGRHHYKMTGEYLDQNRYYESVSTLMNEFHFIKAGFDYIINEKNELTFLSMHTISPYDGTERKSFIFYRDSLTRKDQSFSGKNNSYNQNYSLNFKHSFEKEEHELIFDAIYSQAIDWPKSNRNLQGIKAHQQVQLDYTLPLSKGTKFESGLQYRRNSFSNDRYSTRSPVDRFYFSRDIYSGYLTYASKWKSWGLQLGLRGEQVQRNIYYLNHLAKRKKYFSLYPSAYLTYDINDKNQFSLNYSRRVSRPNNDMLNPAQDFSRHNIILTGNSDLKPEYINSIEWNYQHRFKKGDLTSGLFYRYTKHAMNRVFKANSGAATLDPGILTVGWDNYGKEQSCVLEINGTYRWLSWWSVNGGFELYNSYLFGFQDLGAQRFSQWSLNVRNEFKLLKELSLQLFILYRAPRKYLQGSFKSVFQASIALRASVFQGKGDLTLRLSDIFNTSRFRSQIDYPYRQIINFGPSQSPEIFVGFSYNIGGKIKKRKFKPVDSGEGKAPADIGL